MSGETDTPDDSQLQSIDGTTLTPLVRRALSSGGVQVTDWQCWAIHGGVSGASVFRVAGSGVDAGRPAPWSLILKVLRPEPGDENPHTWKREALAYQSGALADLPGDLVAPRCYEVSQRPTGDYWLWLEDIHDAFGPQWPLEQYGRAARHLGYFNGVYLGERPIPTEAWWRRGRRDLAASASAIDQLRSTSEHPLVRKAFPPDVAEGILRLWAKREAFYRPRDLLPETFCHRDSGRVNLFARRGPDGGWETVAIDWGYSGIDVIGEDITGLGLGSRYRRGDLSGAVELDNTVFEGYVQGLREAGWEGDRSLLRLGYTATTVLRWGIFLLPGMLRFMLNERLREPAERVFGRTLEEQVVRGAEFRRLLLAMADEARELMDVLMV